MMTFLRRQSQAVLIIILAVLGLSFLFYGNVGSLLTNSGGRGGNDYGRIDNRDVSVAELYNAIRSTRYMFLLQDRVQELNQAGGRQEVAEQAWGRLLLLDEADKLHIDISDKQLVDFIEGLPIFQENGHYSKELYQAQMSKIQSTLHISPDTFENLMRDNLRIDAVSHALFSPIHVGSLDVLPQYDKYFGPVTVTVATLDPKSFAASSQPTADEVAAEYKAHPDNPAYRTKEMRKVEYILLPLTADQAKLPDKDKKAALEALGEKAFELTVALQPDPSVAGSTAQAVPDFADAAKKQGLAPVTSDFFAADTPPTGLPPSPAFNNAAFALSKDDPISKVVLLDNGAAVIHLLEIKPTELRPLDEVKGDITQQLQQAKMQQMASTAAQTLGGLLQQEVAKGTDFATAATAQKLSVKTVPAFVPAKANPADPMLADIAESTTRLEVGQVSPAISTYDGQILFLHIDKRDKGDPAGLAAFADRIRNSQEERIRDAAEQDWANWRTKQPNTHKPPDLDSYGGVD